MTIRDNGMLSLEHVVRVDRRLSNALYPYTRVTRPPGVGGMQRRGVAGTINGAVNRGGADTYG